MATTTSPVSEAPQADLERLVAVIALAFGTDPVARWSMPEPQRYLRCFPGIVRVFGSRGVTHCITHDEAGACAAAAIWMPPGVGPDEAALATILQEGVAPAMLAEVSDFVDRMGGYHPDEPHWHLPFIGVDPVRQHRGLGSALLRHALGQCDRDHVPAYLESINPANIPLYERHGFRRMGEIQVGSSPVLVPMLRAAR
jgi:GNAT superfamily N-acetyltransferase